MNKYNWEGLDFPSEKDDWEKFEKNIVSIYNSNREKQVILLMIPNGEKSKAKSRRQWHYLTIKK